MPDGAAVAAEEAEDDEEDPAVDLAAAAVGALLAVGRVNPPPDKRVTATAIMATSANARMTVTTIPPIGARSFGGGFEVSNCGTLLGSTLPMRAHDFR